MDRDAATAARTRSGTSGGPPPVVPGAPHAGLLEASRADLDGYPVLRLVGELDMLQEPKVREALLEMERLHPSKVVVDLSGLSFIDSTGLRLLLEADARARHGGWRLVIAKGPGELPKVFTLTLLDRRLTFVDDPSEDPFQVD